jgi:hypothetical protein
VQVAALRPTKAAALCRRNSEVQRRCVMQNCGGMGRTTDKEILSKRKLVQTLFDLFDLGL